MNILMSHYNNDDKWQSVSIGEWEQVKKSKDLLYALSINDILPYNEPIDSLTIKADNHTWGGIFKIISILLKLYRSALDFALTVSGLIPKHPSDV